MLQAIDAPGYHGFPFHVPEPEGWDIFEASGSANKTPFQLQAVDELDVFDTDEDAWRHVVRAAAGGSQLHIAAVAFLAARSVRELVFIINYLWKEGG